MIPFINIHTHQRQIDTEIIPITNQYPNEFDNTILYYSIGIHPWFIKSGLLEAEFSILNTALATKNCLALGECGLDKRLSSN